MGGSCKRDCSSKGHGMAQHGRNKAFSKTGMEDARKEWWWRHLDGKEAMSQSGSWLYRINLNQNQNQNQRQAVG